MRKPLEDEEMATCRIDTHEIEMERMRYAPLEFIYLIPTRVIFGGLAKGISEVYLGVFTYNAPMCDQSEIYAESPIYITKGNNNCI